MISSSTTIHLSASSLATTKAPASTVSVSALWICMWANFATTVRPVTPSQRFSPGIIVCTYPRLALRAHQGIGTMRPVAPPAKLVPLDLFSPTKLPPLPVRLAFPVRARLVLVAAASVICVHPACSPTSLVRLNALPVRKEKNSLTKINRDVLHVMQGSIKTPKLNSPVCGAFLGSINLPVTVPNAEFASMGDISRQWGRLDA